MTDDMRSDIAHEDPPLTQEQMQMMAFIDGEMTPAERESFERQLAGSPELAVETTRHKNLMEMTRSMALMEPTDYETRRFWSRFYNRSEWQLGWCLLLLGLVVLVSESVYLLLVSSFSWHLKAAVLADFHEAAVHEFSGPLERQDEHLIAPGTRLELQSFENDA